jgi:NADPH-dependent glutamate synthase beta subunit-like oxidoreductase
VNLGKKVPASDRVLIVGGGNVGIDCARTCVRLGFKEVSIVYRRSRQEMPAIAAEVEQAEKEGVKFHFLATPVRILAESGQVTGAECVRMKLGKPDASGRRSPNPVPGSEFTIETDMIIAATGEQPDLSFIKGDDIKTKNGLLSADPVTLQTGVPAIFAGGDVVTGPATVIDALAAGRKAAVSIDRYLKGEPLETGREGEGSQTTPLVVETAGVSQAPRKKMPVLPVSKRHGTFEEVETGYTREEACAEAARCLACGCQVCIQKLGCPAITIENGEVTIDRAQCPGCSLCAKICPAEAIVPEKATV